MHWSYCDISTVSADALQSAYENLSPSRKEHIDRLGRKEDKTRSLAGEILAQALLKEHYGIRTAKLHRHTSGQPYFSGCDLHISISHCDEMVACAVSQEPVGIDIEKIKPVSKKLIEYTCTKNEKDFVLGGKETVDTEATKRFFAVWTAKEAFFKKQNGAEKSIRSIDTLSLEKETFSIDGYYITVL